MTSDLDLVQPDPTPDVGQPDPATDAPAEPADDAPDDDTDLRPRSWDDFIGQSEMVQRLRVFVDTAAARNEPLDHCLFVGPPGLGKTTLANLIATSRGARLVQTSGPSLDRPADLIGTLCRLQRGDVLFIDEIHRTPKPVQEYLYTAMEDFRIDVTTEKGGTTNLRLQRFTLVGATTREGLLTEPFRARCGIIERLQPYTDTDLQQITAASAARLDLDLDAAAAAVIARRCRGTPRIANRLLKRLRDFAQHNAMEAIGADFTTAIMDVLGINAHGLNDMDRAVLHALEQAKGRAVGLKVLAKTVNEEAHTIETNHEPFLMRLGFVAITPKGRMITDAGRAALGAL